MKIWTFGEIYDKNNVDLDLTNEGFVTFDEHVGYVNEAIREAEAEILKIHEDYFLKQAALAITNGVPAYSLPSDIYANKIRGVIYQSGSIIYEVKRLRDPQKFLRGQIDNISPTTTLQYRYFVQNTDITTDRQLIFYPTPYETGSLLTLWYLRNASQIPLSAAGSVAASRAAKVDIPEFSSFIMQYAKCRILAKDRHPMLADHMAVLQSLRTLMVDTLSGMIPDNQDEVPPDFSHYWEHE